MARMKLIWIQMKIHKAALCSLERLLVKNKPLSAVIVLWQIMYEVQLVQ